MIMPLKVKAAYSDARNFHSYSLQLNNFYLRVRVFRDHSLDMTLEIEGASSSKELLLPQFFGCRLKKAPTAPK